MTSKDINDQFAEEASRRFDEFTSWMTKNWPHPHQPLMHSDFDESRKELSKILGPKLGDEKVAKDNSDSDENVQYVSANPMPWP